MNVLLNLLKGPLLHVAGFSFVVNLLLLAPALFMLQVFDHVLTSGSQETLLVLLVGMAVALGLMFALDLLRSRLQGVAGSLIGDSLSPLVARTLIALRSRPGGGAGGEGLRDVAALRNLFSAQGLLALFDAPWAVVYLAVIALAHPWLGVAALLSALLMVGLAVVNDRITRSDIEALQKEAGQASRYLEASLHNAEVAQALGMGGNLIERWRTMSARVNALQAPTARKSVAMAALTRSTRQAVQVAMQAIGAWLVISHEASPGVLVASTILLGRALAPVEQIVGSWRVLAEGRLAFRRLSELLAKIESQPESMKLPAPSGRLEAQGLVFRAPASERLILAGVSLALGAGESLAIIGPSGAGKSTLVRLLMGVWQPTAGTVRLDGAELGRWPREALGPYLGYVPQDVELFAGTVAENIARLGPVDAEAVVRAAQRAGVHELILSLPDGYDTRIDPQGTLMSPGQRQRMALARALYGDPCLLVLDEPNANLDGAGELALGEAIRRLRGEVTVVMVTHRTTLVQHMDKLMVLEAGRVQKFGPASEVLQAMQGGRPAHGGQVVAMPHAVGGAGGQVASVGSAA
jgi:ATP-binding cassette, subfamily C, type I secretion system permease/ATPase